jgi:hypothetical protein
LISGHFKAMISKYALIAFLFELVIQYFRCITRASVLHGTELEILFSFNLKILIMPRGKEDQGGNQGGGRGNQGGGGKSDRGLASASEETKKEVSKKGGEASKGGGRNGGGNSKGGSTGGR